ncbi:hypothetical protein [Citricoccus sp. GCM10030269]|uniref:hypothetical protein n=1 Tax=Citricoccus sp. GCM10030269 TaxID=3273388 RepID=UPI00362388C8
MNDTIGIIGLVVTTVGFSLTVWQIWRTANASEKATEALKAATRRMHLNHLLVLLPQLKIYESELDAAQADDDKKQAIRALVSYSHAAQQVAALLESSSEGREEAELVDQLRSSASAASSAKATLVSGATKPVRLVVKSAAEQIGSMSTFAAGLATRYQTKVG